MSNEPRPCPRPCLPRRYLRHGMLPQLAAFEAVVRLGSATRAAEALCLAQPTLSGHLRKLSEALGVRLFEQRGKRLIPTDAALAVLHTARDVFAAFERCEQMLAGLRIEGDSAPARRAVNKAPDDGPIDAAWFHDPPAATASVHVDAWTGSHLHAPAT